MDPVRTCVGCRTRFAQRELARFVRSGGTWQADSSTRLKQAGRGAYLCSRECAERARKNRRYPGLGAIAAEYALIESHREETKSMKTSDDRSLR